MTTRTRAAVVITALVMMAARVPPATAQTAPDPNAPDTRRWHDTAEFSYVVTSGNSKSSTLGFKNKLWRAWERSAFELNAGGVRAESETTIDIFAVGTPGDFDVEEETETGTTAESYYLNGRYDRKITERFFWFGGAGWDRNRFAGVENRYTGVAGLGNIWADTETFRFRTDYALTFTKQEDVVENPEVDDTFLGARLSYSLMRRFGASTTYLSDLVLDDNLDETSDFRANMINSVAVAMNSRLALKVSLQWLYDNEPSFEEVELFDAPPPGGTSLGTVLVELDELDTILTTSLVVNI